MLNGAPRILFIITVMVSDMAGPPQPAPDRPATKTLNARTFNEKKKNTSALHLQGAQSLLSHFIN